MEDPSKIGFIKFHSVNEYLKKSLSTECIYAAPIHKLNDPIEKIDHTINIIHNRSEYTAEFRNEFGVYCVTKFSKKHFTSHLLPMWSYYGDDHCGVCLVLQPTGFIGQDFHPVKYVSKYVQFDSREKNDFEIAKNSLTHKLAPWFHENEFRIIFPKGEAGKMNKWSKYFHLKQIIFGYKCKPDKINEVLSWLSNDLIERLAKSDEDNNYLDIRQVREPWSSLSDFAPLRLAFEKREKLFIIGHICTYPQNNKQFYPLGSLYGGKIPDMHMPD